MKRALAPLTWWAIGIGYVLALAVIVLPVTWLGTAAYVVSALWLMLATFVAARVHRVNRRFIATVSAIGGFFAASQIVDSLGDSSTFGRISDLLGLCGSICIIIALIHMLSGRASANIRSVLGDALIVGLGSWLITWVALIEPTLKNRGGSLGASILSGAYQPAGTVVLFLLVLLLFSRSGNRQPSVWLVTRCDGVQPQRRRAVGPANCGPPRRRDDPRRDGLLRRRLLHGGRAHSSIRRSCG